MNKTLENFARNNLRTDLELCTDAQQLLFKRMYTAENLDLSISEAVEQMPIDKLDWAMQQVQRTLDKNKEGG